jgi:hypothetical protein
MAGPFSKGGTPLTPAQQQLQQAAIANAQQFSNVWMPVQAYFANKVNTEAPGLQEQARGQAASTARVRGLDETSAALSADSARGASAGSGRYVMDLGRGLDTAAAATGSGLAGASAAGDLHYVKGLQEVLGLGQADQQQALGGLSTAANEQAQEAGAQVQANAQTMQSVGQIAGLALALA